MLYGSETWLVKKENKITIQRAEIRIIKWMYGIKVTGSWFICSERREVLD